jgi:single-stranded-DNA-specific exonuclease
VLVALDGDRGRGSGRSLPHLDLTRLLDACDDLLLAHGGHAFAAGLTVERRHLPELRERFERLVRERSTRESFQAQLVIDAEVQAHECDMQLVAALEAFAPHGLDNAEPLFQVSDVLPREVREVGDGKHLRLRLGGTPERVGIGFGLGPQVDEMRAAGRVDLAFVPTRNEWRGATEVQFKLKSWRPATGAGPRA